MKDRTYLLKCFDTAKNEFSNVFQKDVRQIWPVKDRPQLLEAAVDLLAGIQDFHREDGDVAVMLDRCVTDARYTRLEARVKDQSIWKVWLRTVVFEENRRVKCWEKLSKFRDGCRPAAPASAENPHSPLPMFF